MNMMMMMMMMTAGREFQTTAPKSGADCSTFFFSHFKSQISGYQQIYQLPSAGYRRYQQTVVDQVYTGANPYFGYTVIVIVWAS